MQNNILNLLKTIPDPEIPVIDIVELGIVRDAQITGENTCEVTITPTYSACPAMFTIEEDIIKMMKENGWDAKVVTKMFPIWTTDWLTDEAREKLRTYGITPRKKEQTNTTSGNRKNAHVAVLNIPNR